MKFLLLTTFGLALGGVGMSLYQKTPEVRRSIASLKPYKPHGLILGKQAAAMTLEIVGPEAYPDNSSEIVELVGYITQQLPGESAVAYSWTLPEGVELVRGPIGDNLMDLKIGEARQVGILVRGFSRESQKLISLQSRLVAGGTLLTASSVVVSRPEETREARVMDLQAQARAAAAEQEESESASETTAQ